MFVDNCTKRTAGDWNRIWTVHDTFLIYNYDNLLAQDPVDDAPEDAPWYENHWLWTPLLPIISCGIPAIIFYLSFTVFFEVSSECELPVSLRIHLQHCKAGVGISNIMQHVRLGCFAAIRGNSSYTRKNFYGFQLLAEVVCHGVP